jgi:hypothetical protein
VSRAARNQPQHAGTPKHFELFPAPLVAMLLRLVSATQPRSGRAKCAGTMPLPGWFFLDKIFGGRKV